MTEVFVYVEGPSDQLGMRELLAEIMSLAAQNGNNLDFYPLNGKEALLNKGYKKALNILRNRPHSHVFLVPDLYPPNKPFPHSNFDELKNAIENRFENDLKHKNCDHRLVNRFHVHCFKYDFESLILASQEALLSRIGQKKLSQSWTKNIEDQNHRNPPKRIVEALFRDAGLKYKDTIDAPWILQRSSYLEISKKCPENFRPFLQDLFATLKIAFT